MGRILPDQPVAPRRGLALTPRPPAVAKCRHGEADQVPPLRPGERRELRVLPRLRAAPRGAGAAAGARARLRRLRRAPPARASASAASAGSRSPPRPPRPDRAARRARSRSAPRDRAATPAALPPARGRHPARAWCGPTALPGPAFSLEKRRGALRPDRGRHPAARRPDRLAAPRPLHLRGRRRCGSRTSAASTAPSSACGSRAGSRSARSSGSGGSSCGSSRCPGPPAGRARGAAVGGEGPRLPVPAVAAPRGRRARRDLPAARGRERGRARGGRGHLPGATATSRPATRASRWPRARSPSPTWAARTARS